MSDNPNTSEKVKERRSGGLMPVSVDMRILAKNVLGKRGFSNVDLIAHWSDIVGEKLAVAVKPDKISFPKNDRMNGTLYVRVQSGAFATVLEHQKNIVLDRINTFFGYDALSNIKIQQDAQIEIKKPSEQTIPKELTEEQKEMLQKKLEGITDETLKNQLYEIGKKLFLK
ncbi:MAG: DUF721 domain-containing protein [Alphaproteobacteria bacterium]|nr:DUF721 domain-containing protein [Alphaproteobacteria bacterium]